MARQLGDFLTAYLEYTKDTESPTQYHLWCGISAIASALQRKVYLPWGVETIFPNLYVVLIGPSGRCRKGVAMGIMQDIVREVKIPHTAETITREKLIRRFKDSISSYEDPEKGIQFHCSLSTFSEELHVFLGEQDKKFLADLTDFYNCKVTWTYDTKNQGTDTIQNICYNILGATAPEWLSSILPQEAIGGGLTARMIFVVEEEKKSWITRPPKPDFDLREKLIRDLEQIYIMGGKVTFSEEALIVNDEFYLSQRDSKKGVKDPKFETYNERRGTTIRKLAMIMSASRNSSRKVEKEDVVRAINILEAVEVKMPRVFRTLGKARYAELTLLVFDYIVKHKRVPQTQILRVFFMDIDNYTLDIITQNLVGMKVIRIELIPNGAVFDKVYILIDGGNV